MCKHKKKAEIPKEMKDMSTVAKPKPVESLDIEFNSDEEIKNFKEIVNNPPEPSDFVKKLIKNYQEQQKGNDSER